MTYPGQGHPWNDFLHHRARVMRWLRDEFGRAPKQIANQLSMDEQQVALVMAHVDAHPDEYPAEQLGGDSQRA